LDRPSADFLFVERNRQAADNIPPSSARPCPPERTPRMVQLTLKLVPCGTHDSCALCGKHLQAGCGLHLVLDEDQEEAVCRECGRQHAPSLAALLELASVAERVGRIGRHTLVPPLNALLDLARAAENYHEATPVRQRQAA
jgi:hypothetical protein